MVETIVPFCARAIGGRAMEMVAGAPPIMNARRVVLILAFPVGRLLMVTSADARCGWLVKSVRKTVDNVASSVPSSNLPVEQRADALACNVETAMWIAERGQDPDFASLIDPNTTALVVIDVQNDFCHADGAFGRVGHDNSRMPALAAALHRLLAEARARQVFTVFVRATYDREVTSRPLAQHRKRLGLM